MALRPRLSPGVPLSKCERYGRALYQGRQARCGSNPPEPVGVKPCKHSLGRNYTQGFPSCSEPTHGSRQTSPGGELVTVIYLLTLQTFEGLRDREG